MKKTIKGFVLGLIIATLFMSTALGAEAKKTIEVAFNSINLKVNGKNVNADNILYEGTTYVPLRAVSEILGKYVSWDSKTNTAIISDNEMVDTTPKLTSMDFSELHNNKGNFERTNFSGMFSDRKVKVRNEEFLIDNGILLSSIYSSQVSYVLDEEFTKLTGYFACNDDNQSMKGTTKYKSSLIDILGDGNSLRVQTAYRGEKPQYFEIDITGVDVLTFNGGKIIDWSQNQAHFGGVLIDLKLWK